MTKILMGIHTPFQVNFFEQLIDRADGLFEYLFAARDRDSTVPMLEEKGLDFVNLGGYPGSELEGKLREYADAILRLDGVIDEFDPDLVLTERYPAAVRAAHMKGIPCWTVFNDEREYHVNHLTHPLASKVFVPSFYREEILLEQGVDMSKVVSFNGFITCYLKGTPRQTANPFLELPGIDPGLPFVLVRPEFEFSVFFEGYEPVLEKIVPEIAHDLDVNLIVMPRTKSQAARFREPGVIVAHRAFKQSPVAASDLVLGAAESMLCEAFTLGVPAVSSIYWKLTEPMKLLHRYIPHSTDAVEVKDLATAFIEDPASVQKYRETSEDVIGEMDDPVDILLDAIENEFG